VRWPQTHLCNLFKKTREALRPPLSQSELGGILGYASAHQYVSNWERHACPPPFGQLPIIAKALKLTKKDVLVCMIKDLEDAINKLNWT
jgi:hypothetical protein